jgi:hypothetical protein
MAARLYFIPEQSAVVNGVPCRFPKYLGWRDIAPLAGVEGIGFSALDYGFEPVFLVGAEVTAAQHAILAAQTDVLAVPANLDNNLSAAAVTATRNFLEILNVPAVWVTTAQTYRQVVRVIGGLFQFMQRLHGIQPSRLFQAGTTLSTQYSQLPANSRASLLQAAQSFGYDTTSLSGTSTLRQILKVLADQWGSARLVLGPVEI